jgi:hypothetical protein
LRLVTALIGLCACAQKAPCAATLSASGAATAAWDDGTELECEGFGPYIDDSVDMYFRNGFDALRVRADFVVPGDTGVMSDYFISFAHNDDEWGSFDDLPCTLRFDRDEDIGSAQLGFRRWAVEGSVSCDGPLTPFQSEGTVDIGTVVFAGSYDDAS